MKFICEYDHGGATHSVQLEADSIEDAKSKISKLSHHATNGTLKITEQKGTPATPQIPENMLLSNDLFTI